MKLQELGNELFRMYEEGKNRSMAVPSIILFGIKYGKEIEANGYNAREVVDAAKLKSSYTTELHKGMKLASYAEATRDL